MKKFVCEDCGKAFEAESKPLFSPDCPDCGSYDTTEASEVSKVLTEYEASQD